MVWSPSTQAIAIACGTGGAYVDVTADVMDAEGSLSYQWGSNDPLQGANPGQFTFTLASPTGIYAPDNVVTSLGLPLTEGMGVSWQLNTRIVAGRIRSIETIFPSGGRADAARVRVTCDDVLGDLARTGNDNRPLRAQSIDVNSLKHWPMDADRGSTVVFDTASSDPYPMTVRGWRESTVFGQAPVGGLYSWGNGVEINPASVLGTHAGFLASPAVTGIGGLLRRQFIIDARLTREVGTSPALIEITGSSAGSIQYVVGKASTGVGDMLSVGGITYAMPLSMQTGQAHEIAISIVSNTGSVTAEIWGDNGFYATVTGGPGLPMSGTLGLNIGQGCAVIVERVYIMSGLAFGPSGVANSAFGDKATPMLSRIIALNELTGYSNTYVGTSADLSTRSLGEQTSASSFLDAYEDIMAVDGGRLYGKTDPASTLTAPIPTLCLVPGLSARATTLAAAGTFSVSDDIKGAPEIVRDTTARLTQVNAQSETAQLLVRDTATSTVATRSGTYSAPVYDPLELRALASDRLRRTRYTGSRIRRISIDARGTTASRWADILALYPGARVRVSDMPTTQFGLGYWDGWFIGASETHTAETNTFDIYLEPYLPPYVFDTARFAAGGDLTLTSNITNSATTLSLTTTGASFTTNAAEFPQKIIIDREVIQLNSAPVGTPQVFSGVTRGVANTDGVTTLAVVHLAGAQAEIHPTTEFRL